MTQRVTLSCGDSTNQNCQSPKDDMPLIKIRDKKSEIGYSMLTIYFFLFLCYIYL